jgi:signal transduction histidine kinase
MAVVSQARPLRHRALDASRRLTGSSELPVTGAVLLALLALIQVTGGAMSSGPDEPVFRSQPEAVSDAPSTVVLLLALLATAAVALVRTHLLVAAATVVVANTLTLAGGSVPTVAAMIALVVVGYLVAKQRPNRLWLGLLLPFVLLLAVPPPAVAGHEGAVVATLIVTVAACIAGSAARSRAEAATRRASEEFAAGSLLEQAAMGERARIARDLHDVVAHHISMISVQAETARLTTPGMPQEGANRLSAIGDTAREALGEMRRLLGVLREDAYTPAARAPQPGLADLVELVDGARVNAGAASTRLIVHGPVTTLDSGVELAAYRIVQEALTNSRRHAPGAGVDVELEYGEEALRVRVRDNGPGREPSGEVDEGLGLLGMRERASMAGGVLRAQSGCRGGFLVEATLPLERAAS